MDKLQLIPYLTFEGTCLEAMEYYKQVFGGKLELNYFGELYPDMPEADKSKVMHAELTNDAVALMASDNVPGTSTVYGDSVRISVTGTDTEKLAWYFEKLGQGGTVVMPFEQQAWGQHFGMLTDRFGTHWMVAERG